MTEPKTKSSRRKIVLPDEVIEVLHAHLERQEQARIKAGANWHEQGLVFCNRNGEFMVEWWYSVVVFHKLLAEAGLPKIRFHDLRHSMAITMDTYSHVLPSMQQDVARKLGEMFRTVFSYKFAIERPSAFGKRWCPPF